MHRSPHRSTGRPRRGPLAALLGLALALAGSTAAAAEAGQAKRFEDRAATVEALLQAQARLDGDAQARVAATVQTLLRHAREDRAEGRIAQAEERLDHAYRLVRAAVSAQGTRRNTASGPPRTPDPVGRSHALDARFQSVNALAEAHARIGAQEGAADAEAVGARVAALSEQAEGLRAGGDLAQAGARLDEALALLREAIARHRDGHTLVRELSFASPEEEYRYELDRHQAHRMLLELVLREQGVDPPADPGVRAALGASERLHADADRQARGGDYAAAIATLEDATAALIRLLRASGLYVPG